MARPEGGGEGWASELRASAEAPGPRPLGRPPGLGSFSSPWKELRASRLGAGDPGGTQPGRCDALSLCCGIVGIFFFFFCIIHSLPSPSRPSPAPLLLPPFRSSARTLLTPEFSSQHVPRPGATLARESLTSLLPEGGKTRLSKSGREQWPPPTAPLLSSGRIRDYWKPGLYGSRLPFFSFFFSVFLSGSSSALEAFAGLQNTLPATLSSFHRRRFPHQIRARARTRPARGSPRPRGKVGAA